jgi:hypothetical protein
MSQMTDPSTDKNPKAKKTISIEAHIDEKLTQVCGHLGCSIHSYLVAKVGEAVSRDFVQFQLGSTMNSQDEFMRLMTQILTDEKITKD